MIHCLHLAERNGYFVDETERAMMPRRRAWFELHCPQLLALYLVVSALDFVATKALLDLGGFREANPIALYFLYGWGPRGLLYFKAAVTGLVCVISQIVARKRERTAQFILEFGTLVVTLVLLYSAWLMLVKKQAYFFPS
jgi:hypothetical protein